MTTILAVQGDDFVVVGADSQISSFDDNGYATQMGLLASDQSKVQIAGRFLLGVAGDVRAINIIQHAFTPPSIGKRVSGRNLDRFITKEFIPELRKRLETEGYATSKDGSRDSSPTEATVVVAINAVVFVVDSDFGWTRNDSGIFGVGTGSTYGLGALAMGARGRSMSEGDAIRLVKKALRVAEQFDPFTGGPFRVFVQRKS